MVFNQFLQKLYLIVCKICFTSLHRLHVRNNPGNDFFLSLFSQSYSDFTLFWLSADLKSQRKQRVTKLKYSTFYNIP